MRHSLAVALITAMLTLVAGSALAVSFPSDSVTIRGRLQMVTTFGVPHYEVAGYVVLHDNPATLSALTGLDVIASGVEFTGPTIYMRKVLKLTSISLVAPAAAPREDFPITIPVVPDPDMAQPDTGGKVSIPSPPSRLYGTSFYLLFGRLDVVMVNGVTRYYLYTEEQDGKSAYPVSSSLVDLQALVGRQVGAVASPVAGDEQQYNVHFAVAVDSDIAEMLRNGNWGIYFSPPEPIVVFLRGQPVYFDRGADPIMGNGRTLVGLRAIAEALGAVVTWDEATRTATVRLGDTEVLVRVGASRVEIHRGGQPDIVVMSDIAPVVYRGRTLVPLRVLSEGLGLQVDWNQELYRVELE